MDDRAYTPRNQTLEEFFCLLAISRSHNGCDFGSSSSEIVRLIFVRLVQSRMFVSFIVHAGMKNELVSKEEKKRRSNLLRGEIASFLNGSNVTPSV